MKAFASAISYGIMFRIRPREMMMYYTEYFSIEKKCRSINMKLLISTPIAYCTHVDIIGHHTPPIFAQVTQKLIKFHIIQ